MIKRPGKYKDSLIESRLIEQKLGCRYCQCSLEKGFHVDHVIPISKGGSNEEENLVLSCERCNVIAHNSLFENIQEKTKYILARRKIKGHLIPNTFPEGEIEKIAENILLGIKKRFAEYSKKSITKKLKDDPEFATVLRERSIKSYHRNKLSALKNKKKYYLENREEIRAESLLKRQNNLLDEREKEREWRDKNSLSINQRQKDWRRDNPEKWDKIKAKKREKWHLNKEEINRKRREARKNKLELI